MVSLSRQALSVGLLTLARVWPSTPNRPGVFALKICFKLHFSEIGIQVETCSKTTSGVNQDTLLIGLRHSKLKLSNSVIRLSSVHVTVGGLAIFLVDDHFLFESDQNLFHGGLCAPFHE